MKLYTPPLFGTDISEYQKIVGPEYPHEVFTCRVHNGYRLDRNFTGNRDAINRNPRVKVKVGYIVPVAGMSNAEAVALTMKVLPKDWGVMIDEESGPGFHGAGDHSTVNNDLRERFLNALGARSRNQVFGYANSSDWSQWRHRGDTPGVVAGYMANMPALAKQDWVIGWQYAGGDPKWQSASGFPRGAAGIGNNIDMNVYGFPNGDAMHAWMFGGTATPTTPEDDMSDQDVEKIERYIDLSMTNNIVNGVMPLLQKVAAQGSGLFAGPDRAAFTQVAGGRAWIPWYLWYLRGRPAIQVVAADDPLLKLPLVGRAPDTARVVQVKGNPAVYLVQGGVRYHLSPDAFAAYQPAGIEDIQVNDPVMALPAGN